MPRSATDRNSVLRESFGRSGSSEDMEHAECHDERAEGTFTPREGHGGTAELPFTKGKGPKLWSVVVLSVLGSAVAVAAVGCFCALIYPILKELRAERVRGQDGTEERMLGFWSILVLSLLVGCICCVFSWSLTYLNSHRPSMVIPALTLAHFREVSENGFHLGYGVAVLNGIMAMLTVIWSLT